MATTSQKVPQAAPERRQTRPVRIKSLARCLNIPAMRCIVEVITSIYARIKRSSPTTEHALTSAESVVTDLVNIACPIVATFQKPIQDVDNLVCSGLDYVENMLSIKEESGQEEPTSTIRTEEKTANPVTTQPEPKEKSLLDEKPPLKVATKTEERPLQEEKPTPKTEGTTEKVTVEKTS